MAVNVKALPGNAWKSTYTRAKLQQLLVSGTPAQRRQLKAVRAALTRQHKPPRGAKIKYFPEPLVLEMCDITGVEPVLTLAGEKWVSLRGGLTYRNGAMVATPAPAPAPTPVADPAPAPVPGVNVPPVGGEEERARKLAALQALVRSEITAALQADHATTARALGAAAGAAAQAVIDTKGAALLAAVEDRINEAREVKHVFVTPAGATITMPVGEHFHPVFHECLMLARWVGEPGTPEWIPPQDIALVGPTGCGKSHLGEQLAKALGIGWGSNSCSEGMSEVSITGALLPIGEGGKIVRVPTAFLRCYRNGGVYVLDEGDAASANVLLVMNSAIANGGIELPLEGYIKRHPHFVLVIGMNTWGKGANREYVGRNRLDGATLDRFAVGQVEMDYDRGLEAKLVPATPDGKAWLARCWQIRDALDQHRIHQNMSTRTVLKGWNMLRKGDTVDRILTRVSAAWTPDERSKCGIKPVPFAGKGVV